MLLHELLSERVSSVVYHATSFKNAAAILETGAMKTFTGHHSFTRSLTGAYHRSNKMIGVIFVFDGDKLNANYKGGPVGTEQFDFIEDEVTGKWREEVTMAGKENGQLEDRITTDEIPNITRYIKTAIMYIPSEHIEGIDERSMDELETVYAEEVPFIAKCYRTLKQLNIPIVYVAYERDLTLLRQNKDQFQRNVRTLGELFITAQEKRREGTL